VGEKPGAISADQYLGGLFMFVYRASRRYFLLMLVSAFLVGAIVQVLAGRTVQVYGGRALIQLGAVDGNTLTKPTVAIAAIDSPSFRKRLLELVDLGGDANSRSAEVVLDSLSARPDADDVIAVSVRATDERLIREVIGAFARLLGQKEEQKRKQRVANIEAQVAAADAYLTNLTRIQEALAQAKALGAEPTLLGTVLLLDISSRYEEQLASVRANKLALQARLAVDQTYPTRLVDDDFQISVVSGSSRHWRTVLFAVAITLLGFILFALVKGRRTSGQD